MLHRKRPYEYVLGQEYEYEADSADSGIVAYREDEDGNVCTFKLAVLPKGDGEMKSICLVIGNTEISRRFRDLRPTDVYNELQYWYDGSDPDFEGWMHDEIGEFLASKLRIPELESNESMKLSGDMILASGKVSVEKAKQKKKIVR